MNKPESLRAHLLAAVPELRHSPDRLLVFIDKGKLRCTAAASLSWEYNFELQVILTDFAGHPDAVMLPLLAWVRTNQPELLANLDKSAKGIGFEADILDHSKVDLAITLPLTERVITRRQADGTYQLEHALEPQLTEYQDPGTWQVFAGGELLAEWKSGSAGDALSLETPHPGHSRG
ncbi:phage tail protein [uncultured Pseudomonas sp.]|uniref:phage tail protein n=1 Tax=uncultured Pseudomonas sp. TaxID=114707 RepID=UPI0025E6AD4C|nr:phage tail protein [uncultured Pseudomonas sp.]